MTSIVCVHGAFRGGWSFGRVRNELRARGHDVWTPSLTGMGDRAHLRPPDLSLDTWATDVAALIETQDLHDVLLVGHSMGGMVITAASHRCAGRLAGLVYLDAAEPRVSERGVDLLPGPPPSELPPRATWLEAAPLDASSGLDAATLAWANERLGPTPFAPSLDPLVASDPRAADLLRSRLFCDRTPDWYPAPFMRQRCDEAGQAYERLDAPHDAILSHPDAVAAFIDSVAHP